MDVEVNCRTQTVWGWKDGANEEQSPNKRVYSGAKVKEEGHQLMTSWRDDDDDE